MHRLWFWSRLAAICNLFFVLSAVLQQTYSGANNATTGTVYILGYFLALILNPLINLIYLLKIITGKKHQLQPFWLACANFVALLLQLLFIIFLNDKQHR